MAVIEVNHQGLEECAWNHCIQLMAFLLLPYLEHHWQQTVVIAVSVHVVFRPDLHIQKEYVSVVCLFFPGTKASVEDVQG